MSRIRENRFFTGLYYVVVVALLVVGAVVAYSALPVSGNSEIKTVQSGSMSPAINKGAVVLVKPAENYAEGDIITFDKDFKDSRGRAVAVTHRVVEVKEVDGVISYVTKGDANKGPDSGEVLAADVIGKVSLTVPYLGYPVDTARTPAGFVVLLVVPALLIIYGEIVNIWREVRMVRKKPLNGEAV